MKHQKGELSTPSWGSRIKSAFTGSQPINERIWAAIESLQNSLIKTNDSLISANERIAELMINFNRLDAAIAGAVADINELKTLRPYVADLEARIAALEAQNAAIQGDIDQRAATIEEARGGSMGGP